MQFVVVVDPDASFCQKACEAVETGGSVRVEDVRLLADGSVLAELHHPDAVIVGPGILVRDALEFGEAMAKAHSGTAVVLITSEASTDVMRRAMRIGIRDVIPAEQPWAETAPVLRAVMEESASRRPTAAATESAEPVKHGRVVTIFSTKGGVGKSVIACNVATALAQAGSNVILVDLDLQFGDTGIMLDLKPERTIFDAAQNFDRLDPQMLKGYLVKHSSGVQVLLAPVHPEDADAVTVSRIAAILGMLREIADVVVVDTAAAFDDIVLAAIDASDVVYAVATMDVASIKNTRVSLQKLRQLGYDSARIKLVLNRADSKVWLDAGEVESSLNSEATARIPSDRLVPRSVNRGVPVVLDSPRSPVSRSLVELAKQITAAGMG